jgi:hypothetical protein
MNVAASHRWLSVVDVVSRPLIRNHTLPAIDVKTRFVTAVMRHFSPT